MIPAGPSRLCLARCNPKVISSQRVARRALASAWAAYAGFAPDGSGGRDENNVTMRLSSMFSSINIGVSAAAALSPVTSSSAPARDIRELRIPVLRAGAALDEASTARRYGRVQTTTRRYRYARVDPELSLLCKSVWALTQLPSWSTVLLVTQVRLKKFFIVTVTSRHTPTQAPRPGYEPQACRHG